jgi:hypothetical protein
MSARESRPPRRIFLALLLTCGLAACGTYNLGNVRPQVTKTADQQQLDILTCKDQASLAVNSAGHQTADFFLGLTIVGAPVAYENDKTKARQVYADCMQARGYVVTLPDAKNPTASTPAATTPPPGPGANQLALALPPGFAMAAVPEALMGKGVVFYAINRTLDIGLMVTPVRHEGIADLPAYAQTMRASQADRLTDATWSEVTHLEVNGRNAARYTVTGTHTNVKLTYVTTLVEGHDQIVVIDTWTGATNAHQQIAVLESIAGMLSGIS